MKKIRCRPWPARPRVAAAPAHADTAVLAGGCFWGMETRVRACEGRHRRRLRLCRRLGARRELRQVSSEATGHAEAVQISYDPRADQLRPAAPDLLHRGARSDPGEPPGPGQRPELS